MSNINIDIKPTGTESVYIEAPFDKGKKALEDKGYKLISLHDNALLRIQQGKNHDISRNGNWVREGVLYVPNKGRFLTKNSPIMDNAKETTACHRKGEDFYLTEEQVEEALKDSIKLESKPIPTNRFKDDDITAFAFGDVAEDYGLFLKDAEIEVMPIWLADIQEKPFAKQIWFSDLGNGSGLNGGRSLYCGNGVRGVRYAESVAQNAGQLYSSAQITKALNNLGISGSLEQQIFKTLDK